MTLSPLIRRALLVYATAVLCGVPGAVRAATLDISPTSRSFSVGDTFTATVLVTSTDEALNAVSGTLSFAPSQLEVVSFSKQGSIITLWVQEPAFSAGDGIISFSGVVPNPGFRGAGAKIFAIQFRARRAGSANVSFLSSAVLANDGSGTNILTSTTPGLYMVQGTAPVMTPPTPASALQVAESRTAPASSPPPRTLSGIVSTYPFLFVVIAIALIGYVGPYVRRHVRIHITYVR